MPSRSGIETTPRSILPPFARPLARPPPGSAGSGLAGATALYHFERGPWPHHWNQPSQVGRRGFSGQSLGRKRSLKRVSRCVEDAGLLLTDSRCGKPPFPTGLREVQSPVCAS